MSVTEPGPATRSATSEVRAPATDTFPRHERRQLRETKPSFMTTELWLTLAGVAALIILYNVTDNPDFTLWRMCLLSTILGAAYVVSRGWAKSGSHADRGGDMRG